VKKEWSQESLIGNCLAHGRSAQWMTAELLTSRLHGFLFSTPGQGRKIHDRPLAKLEPTIRR